MSSPAPFVRNALCELIKTPRFQTAVGQYRRDHPQHPFPDHNGPDGCLGHRSCLRPLPGSFPSQPRFARFRICLTNGGLSLYQRTRAVQGADRRVQQLHLADRVGSEAEVPSDEGLKPPRRQSGTPGFPLAGLRYASRRHRSGSPYQQPRNSTSGRSPSPHPCPRQPTVSGLRPPGHFP